MNAITQQRAGDGPVANGIGKGGSENRRAFHEIDGCAGFGGAGEGGGVDFGDVVVIGCAAVAGGGEIGGGDGGGDGVGAGVLESADGGLGIGAVGEPGGEDDVAAEDLVAFGRAGPGVEGGRGAI